MRYLLLTAFIVFLAAPVADVAWADVQSADKALARGDYARARALFAGPAKAGDARAQYELGRLLLDKGDFAAGVRWIRTSSNAGHLPAEVKLGRLYASGMYFRADASKAAMWWERATRHKDEAPYAIEASYARLYLFDAYRYGHGVRVDEKRSLALLRSAADAGNERAQFVYGMALEAGDGVTPDVAEAHKYYVLAWKQNFALTGSWGRVVPGPRERTLTLRKDMTAEEMARSKKSVRAWLDRQKAGELGRVFAKERARPAGHRVLAANERGWERLFVNLYNFSGALDQTCESRILKSRKKAGRRSNVEIFMMDCCGTPRRFKVELRLRGNELVTFGLSFAGSS